MRRLLKALLILVIGLPVIATVGYWYLQQQITQAGVSHLQLDFNRFTLRSVSFASVRFQLEQDGALHQVSLQNVDVSWTWPKAFKPSLQQLTLGPGEISVSNPTRTSAVTEDSAFRLPTRWQLPDWLPEHVRLSDTRLLLPCPAGTCQLLLDGYLTYNNAQSDGQTNNSTAAYWQSQLTISDGHSSTGNNHATDTDVQPVRIDIRYQPSPQPAFELTLQQEKQIGLSLKQQINTDSKLAVTDIVLALSPPSPANKALLQQWGVSLPEAWLSQFQQPVQLYSNLRWQLPADGDLSKLLNSHDIDGVLIARAPDPFYLPLLGLIQGELNAELSLKNQIVERWQIKANGTLSELELSTVTTDYGVRLNPVNFTISTNATAPLDLSALPVQLVLKSSGDSSFVLHSDLTINLSDNPAVTIHKAELTASLESLVLPDNAANFSALRLSTGLSGYWQADNWQLTLINDSFISGEVQSETLSSSKVRLTAENSRFSGNQTGLTGLNTQLNVQISQLRHPALISQNWQWHGQLSGNLSKLELKNSTLSNDAGMTINHQLTYQSASQSLALQWQMPEMFLLAGNSLATTLSDWPELLTLNRGKLSASGDINIIKDELTSNNRLLLGDMGGIYDRSLFAGLTGSVDVVVADNTIQLNSANLQLTRLNHGFEMGPLTLSGSATLPLAHPEQLTVSLDQAELQLMQGQISANNQQLDFSLPANQLILQLQQIDLASLLKQHPSNDLSGNGKLSGTVPITINTNGISVSNGNIAAEAPGGRLQYQSASTSAMAKTNSNMKLVFDALENFQYTVLSSNINYDTSGKLILGLKLQGSNPAVQQGRAINLNINLEEDLPALITSLQLTNKLNDVITQRVQQYLKQQQAAAAANGEKP